MQGGAFFPFSPLWEAEAAAFYQLINVSVSSCTCGCPRGFLAMVGVYRQVVWICAACMILPLARGKFIQQVGREIAEPLATHAISSVLRQLPLSSHHSSFCKLSLKEDFSELQSESSEPTLLKQELIRGVCGSFRLSGALSKQPQPAAGPRRARWSSEDTVCATARTWTWFWKT